MSRWLCIEANFIAGRYHGLRDRGRLAQWPPNPHRLFQALVAGSNLGFRRTENVAAKRAALHWLEVRDPPEITGPPSTALNILRLYVPNNDLDKSTLVKPTGKSPAELRTHKDLRPRQLNGDGTVRFLWPIADAEWETARHHAELLCVEARHLQCLGYGIDMVAGNGRILNDVEKAALAGTVYVASTKGGGWWAPKAGSLDELSARHSDSIRRVAGNGGRGSQGYIIPPVPPRVWRDVAYASRALGRERRVHAFALVDEEGDTRSFDPRRTVEVAAWLRHAAHLAARGLKLDEPFVEGFVCGHGDGTHGKSGRLSYLPLPTIAPKGRDGQIRRVLIAEPFADGGAKALAVLGRLRGAPLVAEGTGEIMAELRAATYVDGVFLRYLPAGGAKRWGTVTPMVLPGRDDHRSRKAVGLVLKALAQAGYTTPVEEVALQAAPVFPGQEMAGRYRVPEYLKAYPRSHAIITFSEKVPGPVTLGSGRHVGIGIFAEMR